MEGRYGDTSDVSNELIATTKYTVRDGYFFSIYFIIHIIMRRDQKRLSDPCIKSQQNES